MAVWGTVVEFDNAPVMLFPLLAAPPVRPLVTEGEDQEYMVPGTTNPFVPLTGVTVNEPSVQTEVVIGLMTDFGFTVIVPVATSVPHAPISGME